MVSRADGFRKGPNSTPGTSGRMKRCSRRWCVIPGRHRANSRTSKPGDRGSHLSRRSGLPPVFLQLVTDRFAAVARKAKRQEWECLLGRSNCLDPAYRKNGFSFPPGRSLGVSFFPGVDSSMFRSTTIGSTLARPASATFSRAPPSAPVRGRRLRLRPPSPPLQAPLCLFPFLP